MINPLPPDQQQQYYVNEYREYKKGFKTGEKLRSSVDPMYLISTLVMLFVAIGRALLGISIWLIKTARRRR